MKKNIGLILIVLFPWFLLNAQALRNDGKINVSAGYLVISGACQNGDAAEITLDGIVTLTGDWINNSSSTVITGSGTDGEVIFNGTSQTIGGSAAQSNFEKLTVNASAIVDITAGKYVTVNGATDISGTLNLKSSASTTTASFISLGDVTGAGTTKAERYVSSSAFHNVSPCVSGQTVANFIGGNPIATSPKTPNNYGMQYYDENLSKWIYFTVSPAPSANVEIGSGYSIRTISDGPVTFSGLLNSSQQSINIYKSLHGWNSVGNPFSSALLLTSGSNSDNFLTYNMATILNLEVGFGLYLWNGTSYTTLTNASENYIQPGQGFIVKAKQTGTVTFTKAMQFHQSPTFYKKSSNSEWEEIKIIVSDTKKSSSTRFFFREDMTKGLDITYDGAKYDGVDTSLNIYSKFIEDIGIKFDIQCLPRFDEGDMVIPLGIDYISGGLVSITSEKITDQGIRTMVLEDRQLGVFTDLMPVSAKYEVVLPSLNKGTGRFFLHFTNSSTNIFQNKKDQLLIYSTNNEIFIKGNVQHGTSAELSDLSGRKIGLFILESAELNTLKVNVKQGIYILKVSGNGVDQISKLFLN